ncbi:MAG: hypothetical protein KAX16_08020, partial [Actinomycetia bacterium]|nr:hypothetical protein [Actinomycetes bacterium]
MNDENKPKIEKRLITVNFRATLAAATAATYVSQRYDYPFRTKVVRAKFALNQAGLLRLYVYISPDPSAPIALPLSGQNLLSQLLNVPYIAGDDETKEYEAELLTSHRGTYIKVFANNTDVNAHTVDVQVTIEVEYPTEHEAIKHPKPSPVGQVKPYELEKEAPTRTPFAEFPEAAARKPAKVVPARER